MKIIYLLFIISYIAYFFIYVDFSLNGELGEFDTLFATLSSLLTIMFVFLGQIFYYIIKKESDK